MSARARHVAVGAGRMGRGIALAFAYAGHRVALVDLKPRSGAQATALAEEALDEIRQSLTALRHLGVVESAHVEAIAGRVQVVAAESAADALGAAQLVFEAVPETLEAKRQAFGAISRHCAADAIVTSTTSTILVSKSGSRQAA